MKKYILQTLTNNNHFKAKLLPAVKSNASIVELPYDLLNYIYTHQWLTLKDIFNLAASSNTIAQTLERFFQEKINYYFDYLAEDKTLQAVLKQDISANRKFMRIAQYTFEKENFQKMLQFDSSLKSHNTKYKYYRDLDNKFGYHILIWAFFRNKEIFTNIKALFPDDSCSLSMIFDTAITGAIRNAHNKLLVTFFTDQTFKETFRNNDDKVNQEIKVGVQCIYPILWASCLGNEDTIKILIKMGAKLNVTSSYKIKHQRYSFNIFDALAMGGHIELFKKFEKDNCAVIHVENLAYFAALNLQVGMMQYLICERKFECDQQTIFETFVNTLMSSSLNHDQINQHITEFLTLLENVKISETIMNRLLEMTRQIESKSSFKQAVNILALHIEEGTKISIDAWLYLSLKEYATKHSLDHHSSKISYEVNTTSNAASQLAFHTLSCGLWATFFLWISGVNLSLIFRNKDVFYLLMVIGSAGLMGVATKFYSTYLDSQLNADQSHDEENPPLVEIPKADNIENSTENKQSETDEEEEIPLEDHRHSLNNNNNNNITEDIAMTSEINTGSIANKIIQFNPGRFSTSFASDSNQNENDNSVKKIFG